MLLICLPPIILIFLLNIVRAKTMHPTFQVREKPSVGKMVIDEIAKFIQHSYPNSESGIVYCFSRRECEQVCIHTSSL